MSVMSFYLIWFSTFESVGQYAVHLTDQIDEAQIDECKESIWPGGC